MARRTVMAILGLVLAGVCAARPALAQTQATTTPGTQPSEDQEQSAAALAREATNPFSSGWLMQMQQNNNWTELPLDGGRRMQSNLMFQPLWRGQRSRSLGGRPDRRRRGTRPGRTLTGTFHAPELPAVARVVAAARRGRPLGPR